jgi:hypothetical protein
VNKSDWHCTLEVTDALSRGTAWLCMTRHLSEKDGNVCRLAAKDPWEHSEPARRAGPGQARWWLAKATRSPLSLRREASWAISGCATKPAVICGSRAASEGDLAEQVEKKLFPP